MRSERPTVNASPRMDHDGGLGLVDPRSGTLRTRGRATIPYRLDIIPWSVADVIASAGGWLFDMVMAGWRVNVRAADHWDLRPLQILGIGTMSPDWELAPGYVLHTQVVAVSAEVYASDECVRESIVSAVERGLRQLTLWGDTQRVESAYRLDDVEHRLSAAARVFKSQSLVAAGIPDEAADGTETFMVARTAAAIKEGIAATAF